MHRIQEPFGSNNNIHRKVPQINKFMRKVLPKGYTCVIVISEIKEGGEPMTELGDYVKMIRTGKEFSMRKLSEMSGISHTEIKRIEDGTRKQPSPQVLRAIAAALNTPYEDLMAAAGYIDEIEKQEDATAVAGIDGADDLTPDEIADVNKYIAFLKSQRNSK